MNVDSILASAHKGGSHLGFRASGSHGNNNAALKMRTRLDDRVLDICGDVVHCRALISENKLQTESLTCDMTAQSILSLVEDLCSRISLESRRGVLASELLGLWFEEVIGNNVTGLEIQLERFSDVVDEVGKTIAFDRHVLKKSLVKFLAADLTRLQSFIMLLDKDLVDIMLYIQCIVGRNKVQEFIKEACHILHENVMLSSGTFLHSVLKAAFSLDVGQVEKEVSRTLVVELFQGHSQKNYSSSARLLKLTKENVMINKQLKTDLAVLLMENSLTGEDGVLVFLSNSGDQIKTGEDEQKYIETLSSMLDTEVLVEIVYKRVLDDKMNWNIVGFVLKQLHMRSSVKVTDLLFRIWGDGYQSSVDLIISALLLARQLHILTENFYYESWLQDTIKKSDDIFANKQQLAQCVTALTKIIPFEQAVYLRIHISVFTSFVISSNLFADYIMMAKAKLRDVSESILIDESKITDESQCEIEKAVLEFAQTKKLSSAILEASIFKKVYFIGTLVPTLLHLALSKEEASIYSQFIAKLQSSGKVPASIIVQYEKFKEDQLLKKQASELGDDTSAVEVLLLDSLANIVKCASSTTVQNNGQACLDSELKRLEGRWKKLDELLKGTDDLHTDIRLKISVGILNQFCKCATVSGIDSIKRVKLLVDLTQLILRRSSWHKPMIDVLSNLLTKEHHQLQAYHRTGLAQFVCLVDANVHQLKANLIGSQVLVVDRLMEEMCHFVNSSSLLRWICEYFLFGVNMFPGVLVVEDVSGRADGLFSISRTSILYFQLLRERIRFKMDHCIDPASRDSQDLEEILRQAALVASSGELAMVIDQNKASMAEWLKFQLKHPDQLLQHYRLLFFQGTLNRSSASNRSKSVDIFHALINYSEESDSDSYTCLLLTLKHIIKDLVDDNEDDVTILGHVIRAVMKDETSLRVKSAFSILNYLPAHLLFSDQAGVHQVSEEGRVLALKFISLLSESIDQPLAFDVVFYIVQAMLSVWNLQESSDMKNALCFFKDSPSTALSVLVYWTELAHKYPVLKTISTFKECHQATESGHLNEFKTNGIVTATIFGRYLAFYWKQHNADATDLSRKRRAEFQSAVTDLNEEVLISLCDCLLQMITGLKGSTVCAKEAYIFLKELTTHVPGILQKLGSADHYLLI